jgi:hypothetical protein
MLNTSLEGWGGADMRRGMKSGVLRDAATGRKLEPKAQGGTFRRESGFLLEGRHAQHR